VEEITNPWDGGEVTWPTADQVIQVLLVLSASIMVIALFIGIVEAVRFRRWKRPKYVKLGIYSTLFTIVLGFIILLAYPLKSISKEFLSASAYLSAIFLAELIPIMVLDDVRETFLRELPILPQILGVLEKGRACAGVGSDSKK